MSTLFRIRQNRIFLSDPLLNNNIYAGTQILSAKTSGNELVTLTHDGDASDNDRPSFLVPTNCVGTISGQICARYTEDYLNNAVCAWNLEVALHKNAYQLFIVRSVLCEVGFKNMSLNVYIEPFINNIRIVGEGITGSNISWFATVNFNFSKSKLSDI